MSHDKFINWSNFRIGTVGTVLSTIAMVVGLIWFFVEPRLDKRIETIVSVKLKTYEKAELTRSAAINTALDKLTEVVNTFNVNFATLNTKVDNTSQSVTRLEKQVDTLVMGVDTGNK